VRATSAPTPYPFKKNRSIVNKFFWTGFSGRGGIAFMRPRYETENDLINEARALDKFCHQLLANSGHRHHYQWRKLPEVRYVIDAAITIDRYVRAWAEVKCRSGSPDDFDHWFVSVHKFFKGINLHDYTNLPFYMIFDWNGQTFAARCDNPPSTQIEWSGRNDRNDDQDMEPLVLIPRDWFKPIGELPEFATPQSACMAPPRLTAPDPNGVGDRPDPRV
jgi:hypothetical protein